MKRVVAVLFLSCLGGVAHAEELNVNLSSSALRGAFDGSLTNLFPRLGGIYEIGGLTGKNHGRNYNQGHAGLLVTGDAGAQQATITAGLGGRIAALNAGSTTGGALALGGMVDARLPAFNRIGALAYAYYAPNASSFGDLKNYFEYSVDADYEVLRAASVYVGFRQLRTNVKDVGTLSLDSGWHLGMRLKF